MLVKHEKINLTSVSVRRLGKLSIVSMECVDFKEAGCARTEPMSGRNGKGNVGQTKNPDEQTGLIENFNPYHPPPKDALL